MTGERISLRVFWGPVGFAMAALAVLLTVTSNGYGWHRDELYFRMLPPQWGYVDQPPLAPLLVRAMSSIVDEPWAIRVPATVAAVLATLLAVLIAKEVGGGRFAQGLAAWGYAFGVFPLLAGHLLSTASYDQVAWLAAVLFVVRAVWRDQPRWWVAFGATVGLATYNELLIALLVVSLVMGSRWPDRGGCRGVGSLWARRSPWWSPFRRRMTKRCTTSSERAGRRWSSVDRARGSPGAATASRRRSSRPFPAAPCSSGSTAARPYARVSRPAASRWPCCSVPLTTPARRRSESWS